MTMMIQRVNANSPAQAVKSRARGPTITQLRAKQAALVAASELAASSDAEASVVRHSPVDEAKRWASGKGRKVGFAKARVPPSVTAARESRKKTRRLTSGAYS